jgi:hypothetical protein
MDGKIYFDPDSPLLVAEGTLSLGKLTTIECTFSVDVHLTRLLLNEILLTAVIGASAGGVMGALRAQNPFALGMNMGLNGAVAGLVFFGQSPRDILSPSRSCTEFSRYHVHSTTFLAGQNRSPRISHLSSLGQHCPLAKLYRPSRSSPWRLPGSLVLIKLLIIVY